MEAKINNPCTKNWSKMLSVDGGRYCSFCDHVVVDFTSMSDNEIKQYFIDKNGQKTCGHFKASQVIVPGNRFINKLADIKTELIQRSSIGIFTKLSLYLVGIIIFMAGCVGVTGKVVKPELTGETVGVVPVPATCTDSTTIQSDNK